MLRSVFVVGLALALASCDTATERVADPFGEPGSWSRLADLDGGEANSFSFERSTGAPVLYVAAGRAGIVRLDVASPVKPPGNGPVLDAHFLGFEVGADLNPYAGFNYGVNAIARVGTDLILGTTALRRQTDGSRVGLFRSPDGGRTWTPSDAGIASAQIPYSQVTSFSVDPSDASTVLAQAGGLYRSSDGGNNWILVDPYGRADIDERTAVAFGPSGSGQARATVTDSDGTFPIVSTDQGRTWAGGSASLDLPQQTFYVHSFSWDGGGALWFTTGKYVAQNRISAGRATLTAAVLNPEGYDGPCVKVVAHPTRPGVAFAGCHRALIVIEGGKARSVQGPNADPITALAYDPVADALYVGAGPRVYRLAVPLSASGSLIPVQ